MASNCEQVSEISLSLSIRSSCTTVAKLEGESTFDKFGVRCLNLMFVGS